MKDISGKVTVITGGGTGIGLAFALALAALGDARIVVASTNLERLEAGAEKIRAAGARCISVVCDVSLRSDVRKLREKTVEAFGAADILVCNAGVTTSGPILEHKPEDYDWVYGVVLQGTVNCIQEFYPGMCARGSGHILVVGSQTGMNVTWVSNHGPYVSAKAAVMHLAAALRPEAAEHGVGMGSLIVAGTETEIMKCERSRPERFGAPQNIELKQRVVTRLPASDVAEQMIRGIKENKEWIATHPELKDGVREYFDRILAAYDR
jgi:NAD(P)-dependent dehydrogenase (short-subunit alcohol dehydrogenase family)